MTVKIEFSKNEEAVTDLNNVSSIYIVLMDFNLLADGESVFGKLAGDEYYAGHFFMFLKVVMKLLPRLYEGEAGQFECASSFELRFEADGETVTVYIHDTRNNESRKRYTIALDDLALELIKTSEEFIQFALDVRPDERGTQHVEQFQDVLTDAKTWYREAHDEDL